MPAHDQPNAADMYALIDDGLDRFRYRHVVAGSEVVDFLLDLRLAVDFDATLVALLEPVAG
jgi:hypothetical protein